MTTPCTSAPAGEIYRLRFDATLDEVMRVCSELNVLALQRGGVEWAAEVDLGLTEALSNVVRHGYGGQPGGHIDLWCSETESRWCLTAVDSGSPIPPDLLRNDTGDVFDFDPNDLQSIPEGGMGLALMRSCFDGVDYRAGQDGNCLTLEKLFRQSAA